MALGTPEELTEVIMEMVDSLQDDKSPENVSELLRKLTLLGRKEDRTKKGAMMGAFYFGMLYERMEAFQRRRRARYFDEQDNTPGP